MASSDLPATSEVLLQTDASKHILDTFLGQGWDTWGTSLGGSQASELMLEMFSAFNLIALAVVSALFIWVLAVAVAGTAHEGTPFGKRYSSLWMPLRFVGAMGALAPIFKGLSLFQVAILACIGFSINLGNYVWELGTDYFVEHGGQLSPQAPDHNVTHYAAITNGALESLTLQYYLNERRGMNITPGGEWKYSGNWFQSGGSGFLHRASRPVRYGQSGQHDHPFRPAKLRATGTASRQAQQVQGKRRAIRLVHRRVFLLVNRLDQSGSPGSHVLRHHLQSA